MQYDELLGRLGEFGHYQRWQFLLVSLVAVTSAWHSMNMVFVGGTPRHHCRLSMTSTRPEWKQGFSYEHLVNLTIPNEKLADGTSRRDPCHVYDVMDPSWTATGGAEEWLRKRPPGLTVKPCTAGWWYSEEFYYTTVVTEWDLVCDKAWLTDMASTVFFCGRLVGAFVCGQLSDRFGRRVVFFASLAIQAAVGGAMAVCTSLSYFFVLYFVQGVVQVSVFLTVYVLGTEMVGPSYRNWVGILIQFFYAVGEVILAGMAYRLRSWRSLELAISIPAVLFFTYYWYMSESVRWLLSKGKKREAEQVLRKTAAVNKVYLPPNVVDELIVEEKTTGTSHSILDLVRTWSIAKISLNVWFIWLVNALVYYGLSLNSSHLSGNPYTNFLLLAAVELPALALCPPLLDRMGRRHLMFYSMLIGAAGCLVTAMLPPGYSGLITTFSIVGKFGITASYAIVYLVAAEVFPTVLRNNGLGMASVCARLGGMVAPQFLSLGTLWPPLPLLAFGIMSLLGSFLCMLLPETSGKPLPQSLQDMQLLDSEQDQHRHKGTAISS